MSNEQLRERLRKILALTGSPNENEAAAAAEHLHRLLQQHNLSMADLETRGAHAPKIGEDGFDLGKAAFTWKLNLAEGIADHYYCFPLIDRKLKTVVFVGRPDNTESLKMLYAWLVDQVKRVASDERHNHMRDTGEHVDPLRWQVNFGLGAVSRLLTRLEEVRERQSDAAGTDLVRHHASEISDYTEAKYGYRSDGKRTKVEQERDARWAAQDAENQALKASDLEAFYARYPWERPLTAEQLAVREAENKKADRAWEKKEARRANRQPRFRTVSAVEARRQEQGYEARRSGRSAADRINLQPFIEGGNKTPKEIK